MRNALVRFTSQFFKELNDSTAKVSVTSHSVFKSKLIINISSTKVYIKDYIMCFLGQ